MLNGIIAGYPVVDVHVDIIDGSYHEVDSNENAFKMAAIFAVKDALKKAKCMLLEPIMAVEVTTPEDYQGDIMGDLNRRRGKISGIETKQQLRHRPRRCAARRNVRLLRPPSAPCPSGPRQLHAWSRRHFEQVPQQHRRTDRRAARRQEGLAP